MKKITPYLVGFGLTSAVLTIAFRYCLSYAIENRISNLIVAAAVLYFISLFIAGWYFGKKDNSYLPFLDIGFRFHVVTFFVHNIISELWFLFNFNAPQENIRVVHLTAAYWAIGLFVHFIFYQLTKRKSINGLNKDEIFE